MTDTIPRDTDMSGTEEARAAHGAMRAKAVRLTLLRSVCMGAAVAMFMAVTVLMAGRAVPTWVGGVCFLAGAAFLAAMIALFVILGKLDRRMKTLLPAFLPADVREAADGVGRTARETRGRHTAGIILLIAGILIFTFGLPLSVNSASLPAGIASAAASGGCIAAGTFLLCVSGGLRKEARIRASLCIVPVYAQAVRDCLGEDAVYVPGKAVSRGQKQPPYEHGTHYVHTSRNRVSFTRGSCPVSVWESDIDYSDTDSHYSVFSGVYVQIRTGRAFGRGFTLGPPSGRTGRLAADGEKSADTPFASRFAAHGKDREACDRILTPHLKSVITFSRIDRFAVLADGTVNFGIPGFRLFSGPADEAGITDRFRTVMAELLPLIDELTVLRDSPADDFAK
ncbi:MAG: hypothetical protein IKP10_06530 [Clostridia bacterium]|nr:hypothetical protein [Clostridia bacterium]